MKNLDELAERLANKRGWTQEYSLGIIQDIADSNESTDSISELRDPRRALALDYSYIAHAQAHYGKLGYADTAVPWVITEEAYTATLPPHVNRYETIGGFLVGSAEQSFIQLLLDGVNPGKAMATSPCFRDEDHDEIHSPYFFKLELFNNTLPLTKSSVFEVIAHAEAFFEQYLPIEVIPEGELAWDIVSKSTGLELGSYGVRNFRNFNWIYGTGVALPRLEQAIASS